MKIYIPHLGYTVEIKKFKDDPRVPNAMAWSETLGPDKSAIYIHQPIKRVDTPLLAHELIHVLQWIAVARGIDFTQEQEHFAYLMQWVMNEVLGYEYE